MLPTLKFAIIDIVWCSYSCQRQAGHGKKHGACECRRHSLSFVRRSVKKQSRVLWWVRQNYTFRAQWKWKLVNIKKHTECALFSSQCSPNSLKILSEAPHPTQGQLLSQTGRNLKEELNLNVPESKCRRFICSNSSLKNFTLILITELVYFIFY